MIRRYGAAPNKGRRYAPRHGVYGLIWRDGVLLLTFQADPQAELQLPGGGIDPGESPIRALHREVHEETGWSISTPRRLGVFRRYAYMPDYDLWAEKICHVYVARPVRRLGPPVESAHAAIWTGADVAIDMLSTEGERAFVSAYARSRL